MFGWTDSTRLTALALVVTILVKVVYPTILKICRNGYQPRSGTLKIISNPEDAKFEIVAVHGLGAHPEHTWTQASRIDSVDGTEDMKDVGRGTARHPKRVHLLRDLLKPAFPQARILSFEHDSRWFTDAPVKTTEEIGKCLLEEMMTMRSSSVTPSLPIIFVGHSLGGIIIKQALCRYDSQDIINDTCGIVFLGAPHQGSYVSIAGALFAFMFSFLGSDTTLLLSLRSHESHLSNLVDTFRARMTTKDPLQQKVRIISFYETKPQYFLGWISLGLVVSRDSAVVHADETHGIDTDHSGLNKCAGPNDELYKQLRHAVGSLIVPSRLKQADAWILENYYTTEALRVERLSGKSLPMDQCYINLAIVEQIGIDVSRSKEGDARLSPFSLLARQKVVTPEKSRQVELSSLFHRRKGGDGREIQPRRILIRGRAGVGKTTLCKKIVYEFSRGTWTEWNKLFDRVLWVRLRNLKLKERRYNPEYDMKHLLSHEYFAQPKNRPDLAEELSRALEAKRNKTLFLLDGLDEVSHDLTGDSSMSRFLNELLKQPNAIITSRPSRKTPPSLDLELETIGFNPDQVTEYLQKTFGDAKSNEVMSFLEKHRLIRGLMQIPIQLDAFCCIWDSLVLKIVPDTMKTSPDEMKTVPDTMTGIYQALEDGLWTKDVVRLDKMTEGNAKSARSGEIRRKVEIEIELLECLAFNGLHGNIIDFTPAHRDEIVNQFPALDLTLDETLARLSFLRTSDSSRAENLNYHFIHLTFEEYFAARYFVRRWNAGKPLQDLGLNSRRRIDNTEPTDFLRKNKYAARYDIFWRFVAGLLETKPQINNFFNKIEESPLDLLGPSHQRLVMHCLSEASGELNPNTRERLENRLSKWLLYECRFRKSTIFASEAEFPEKELEAAFLKGSADVQRTIAASLRKRPTTPPLILQRVASWLDDKDSHFRQAAVKGLGGRSDLPDEVLSAVAARLVDKDLRVRLAAVKALGGRSDLPDIVLMAVAARLEDKELNISSAAGDILGERLNLPHKVVTVIAARLEHKDSHVRQIAARVLRGQSNLPDDILMALAAQLEHNDKYVRQAALKAIGGRSDLPDKVLTVVVARLEHDDLHVWNTAARVLGGQSNLPDSILMAVAARLEHQEASVRLAVIEALGGRADLPEKVLMALAARLEDKFSPVRRAVVGTLVRRSDLPPKVLMTVAARLEDNDNSVRRAVIGALGERSDLPDEILAAMAARLDDEDSHVRLAAVGALGGQTNLPDEVLDAMVARLDDGDKYVWLATARALSRQSTLSDEILRAVAVRLEDEDLATRQVAAGVLERQSKLPNEVLMAVVAQLEHKNLHDRQAAVEALGGQLGLPDEVLTRVAARLDDEEWYVRQAAEALLRRHEKFYCSLLNSPRVASLYQVLFRQSFQEQISWYMDDGDSCLNLQEDIRRASVSDQSDYTMAIANARPINYP